MGLASAHQRPGANKSTAKTHRSIKTPSAACSAADIESVTLHPASGLHRPRVTVLCVRAGTAQSDLERRQASPPPEDTDHQDFDWHEQDYLQDAEDAMERSETRMRDVLRTVHAGGGVAPSGGALGGVPAPLGSVAPTYTLRRSATDHHPSTSSETRYTAFRVAHRLTDRTATDLLRMVKHPDFCPADLHFDSASAYDHRLTDLSWAGIHSHSMHRKHLDGSNECILWYRTAVQIILEMLETKA